MPDMNQVEAAVSQNNSLASFFMHAYDFF